MPAPIGIELREVAVRLKSSGQYSVDEIVELLGNCSPASVRRWCRQFADTGSLTPKQAERKGPEPIFDDALREKLRAIVAREPDGTLDEYIALLGEETNIYVSSATMSRVLMAMRLNRKKNSSRQRARHPTRPGA